MHEEPEPGVAVRWGPALAVMAVIFAASSIPGSTLPDAGAWDLTVKKGGHVLGYALLGVALLQGLTGGRRATPRQVGLALLLAALYGVSDELHQIFTPGRGPSALDVLVDTAGAILGLAARRYTASNWRVKWVADVSPSDTTK
jgi:hypothetical protein